MILLPVTEALLPALVALDRQVAAHPWSEAQFREEMGAGSLLLAGFNTENGLVAHGVVRPMVEEWHLLTLGVVPALRRRGLGRAMARALLARAAARGGGQALLEVAVGNLVAYRLYLSLGFREVGRRKGYYWRDGQVEDALVMTCPLALFHGGGW